MNSEMPATQCTVCPHACKLQEGQTGLCRARIAQGGKIHSLRMGAYSGLALDPIEKKPLRLFYPGSHILSVGGYGCNMRCPFCQNHQIAQCSPPENAPVILPRQLVKEAVSLRPAGNIGIAYTYNEPGVAYEWVTETARLAHEAGLQNVLVTNGFYQESAWRGLLCHMDACNIDLKCFSEQGYASLRGDLSTVKRNILLAAETVHVEITTLIIPGLSDREADVDALASWLATLSPNIPLHISRYFPRFQATHPATEYEKMYRLADIAKRHLHDVFLGNM